MSARNWCGGGNPNYRMPATLGSSGESLISDGDGAALWGTPAPPDPLSVNELSVNNSITYGYLTLSFGNPVVQSMAGADVTNNNRRGKIETVSLSGGSGSVESFNLLNTHMTTGNEQVRLFAITYTGTYGIDGAPIVVVQNTGIPGQCGIRVVNAGTGNLDGVVTFAYEVVSLP